MSVTNTGDTASDCVVLRSTLLPLDMVSTLPDNDNVWLSNSSAKNPKSTVLPSDIDNSVPLYYTHLKLPKKRKV